MMAKTEPKREVYPGLSGREARKRIAEEGLADVAFDVRQASRKASSDRAVRRSKTPTEAEKRERTLVARDRLYRQEERARQEMQLKLDSGEEVSLSDVALGPTQEQFDRAGSLGYEQVSEVGTGKSARLGATVYRRRDCPVAFKMRLAGVIDRRGYEACCWYRGLWESTGLSGNIASADMTREVFASPHAAAMFTDWQIEQQDLFNKVRREMAHQNVRLIDAMVIEDISVHRAARRARTGHRNPKGAFEKAVADLCDARKKIESVV